MCGYIFAIILVAWGRISIAFLRVLHTMQSMPTVCKSVIMVVKWREWSDRKDCLCPYSQGSIHEQAAPPSQVAQFQSTARPVVNSHCLDSIRMAFDAYHPDITTKARIFECVRQQKVTLLIFCFSYISTLNSQFMPSSSSSLIPVLWEDKNVMSSGFSCVNSFPGPL